ncbi:MAG: CocE/NonD family hydrolase [Deltaproteobacteria bacterium]|nr:MAG: CocE/NonD family hydrolase [Deltaproteobacteria bacterium]
MRFLAPFLLLAACSPTELDLVVRADFTVRPGVETATVLDGRPFTPYTLLSEDGERLITVTSDDLGQAHFAYVPSSLVTVQSGEGTEFPFADGEVLAGGRYYEVVDEERGETSAPFRVLALRDVPRPEFYRAQRVEGMEWSPIEGPKGEPQEYLTYLVMRDGVTLSAMVRYPDHRLYGEGPWPTVVEYSGYSPSRPDRADTGTMIANALGYATVSVNMRGTGCSGGVFDVFNRAQHADGYDIVETIARQPWVLGGRVGMVGLSYPGISQLYVASTNPSSLAAIVPKSVIADAWEMQWPGGIYNVGFTEQWVDERERQTGTGQGWVRRRIEAGDEECEHNVRLSRQNFNFESFFRQLEFRPPNSDDRDLRQLSEPIEAAVYLSGQWQDEQTGAQFAELVHRFHSARYVRAFLANGRHPDGYAPDVVFGWFEFLELYLAERIPRLNGAIRVAAAGQFASSFGIESYRFPADRFDDADDYAQALARYESEPPITVLFENGAGSQVDGAPVARSEIQTTSWPPPGSMTRTFHATRDGQLADDPPSQGGVHRWSHDPHAGSIDFFGPRGYELLPTLWDEDWTRFAPGDAVSYLTAPMSDDVVLAGPGVVELYVRSPEVDDVHVQVTLTEVRADGHEVYVQSGWLRLGHRAASRDGLRVERWFDERDFAPVELGAWTRADVEIPAFAHPFRQGSRLRMVVSSPGRDHGTWLFEPPPYDGIPRFDLGVGGGHPTQLGLVQIPGVPIAEGLPPCPSLRGQPCRVYEPIDNVSD